MAQALSWVVSDDDEENENGHMEELSHNNGGLDKVYASSPLKVRVDDNSNPSSLLYGASLSSPENSRSMPPQYAIPPIPPPPAPPAIFNGGFQPPQVHHHTPQFYARVAPQLLPYPPQGFYSSPRDINKQQLPASGIPKHSIHAYSPMSDTGENELQASTRYVSKWSPSLFNSYSSNQKPLRDINKLSTQSDFGHDEERSVQRLEQQNSSVPSPKAGLSSIEAHYQAEIERLKSQIESMSSSTDKEIRTKPGVSEVDTIGKDKSDALLAQVCELEAEIWQLREAQASKDKLHDQETRDLEAALVKSKEKFNDFKAEASEDADSQIYKYKETIEKLEHTFRDKEESLKLSLREKEVALQKALASEVNIQAAYNLMKTERQKLEQEVKTWSGSTNRFRMERDDLAERNADLKRQLNLDSTNLKQAEYQNQKLKQELSTYKLAFEKLESEIVIAKNKEQRLQGAIENLQKQKSELEHNVVELQRKQDAHERNNEMNKNYKINNMPHFSYQGGLGMQTSGHDSDQPREILANAMDYASDRHLGYEGVQNESYPKLVGVERNHVNSHSATSIASDRRSHVSGGVLGREFGENNRYSAISPNGNQMASVFGKKGVHDITSPTRPEGQSSSSLARSKKKNRHTKTEHRIFPAKPLNRHAKVEGTAHSKATKDNGCVINSSRFPLDFADVSDEDNKIKAEIVHPPISQENIREESTAQEKPDEEMALNPPASAHSENQKQDSSVMSFQEAMENARRKKAAAAKENSAEATTFSIASPQKDAAKFAAKQNRAHFKIEDPPSSRTMPASLMSKKEKEQAHLQRVKRYEAAPFATEHSLNLQKKQMSDIEKQLVKLGLEKTMLETELMKNEALARRRMDARERQKKLENRLGEIALMSSKLRRKLKEVEGR